MRHILRKIFHLIKDLPLIGNASVKLLALWRSRSNNNSPLAQALDWEQARQMGSLTERLELVEALLKSQAQAIQGLGSASRTLKQQLGSTQQEQLTQLASANQRNTINATRIEFVRDEVLFELRKALKLKPASAPGTQEPEAAIEPRMLEHVHLTAGEPIRLNLGCGHKPHPDKLNVDVRELPGVDIIAGVDNLPFAEASVDCIHAAHLLEHFPKRYLLDVLLPYWRSLLKPGGSLELVVPDSEAMLSAHQRGEIDFATLAEVTFGKQDYDGDFHYAMYSPASLTALLQQAGFADVSLLASDRINGDCREMHVLARVAQP